MQSKLLILFIFGQLSFNIGILFSLFLFNKSITPPKPFSFIKNEKNSAMPTSAVASGLTGAGIIHILCTSSALLFSSGIYFDIPLEVFSRIFAGVGRFILENIIQDTARLSMELSVYLNYSAWNLEELAHIHGYLTPYIRSYDSIFRLMMGWVNFFDASNSDNFEVLEDMQGRYRVAGNNLLELYRRIEVLLNISPEDSPVAVEDWE